MTVSIEDVRFSFEYGCESDIFNHYILTNDNKIYEVMNNGKECKLIPHKQFKELYGVNFIVLRGRLKKGEYFTPLDSKGSAFTDDTTSDDGIYFENDHEQLVKDGVWATELQII